ncbi:MAG: hypothetical protein FWH42_01495, partial [Dehalococcoidia bacterium]|nr:hypothetical protein [Dehalococcoidia bacterium]
MKISKSIRIIGKKVLSSLILAIMLAGMAPITGSLFTPNILDAQMSTSQKTAANFIDVKTGSWHNLALDDEGRIYTWKGPTDSDNLLGRPVNGDRDIAVQVMTAYMSDGTPIPMPFITKISASESGCVVLDVNGNIWSWGLANRGGEQNVGRSTANVPYGRPGMVELPGGIKAVDITAAGFGGGAVGADGNLYTYGNSGNTLGTNAGTNNALGLSNIAGTAPLNDGASRPTLITHDEDSQPLVGNIKFEQIFRGDYYNNMTSMALGVDISSGDQVIYTWACGTSGAGTTMANSGYTQRPFRVNLPGNIGTPANRIKLIDVGVGWFLFLDSDGDLYTWGSSNSTAGNHMGHGLAAASGHKNVPTKITQVQRWDGSGTSYTLVEAPKFRSASAYAWTMTAIAEDYTIYVNGESIYGKLGTTPTVAQQYYFWQIRPSTMTINTVSGANTSLPTSIDGQPTQFLYVSMGYQGTSFVDQHGNAYVVTTTSGYSGRATAAEPWVHVKNDVTPLFSSIVSVPNENIKRYTTARSSIDVTTSRATDEVKYVILYPDDWTQFVYNDPGVFGHGEIFYWMSFYEIDPPYFMKDSDGTILVSPNGSKETSRYYANPSITEEMFNQAYEAKMALGGPGDAGILTQQSATQYSSGAVFGENCIVWLQTVNDEQTTRIMFPYDNVYTPVNVYVQGVLEGTGEVLYTNVVPQNQVAKDNAHLAPPVGYGVPLNREGDDLAYPLGYTPPLGWDVVQPQPITDTSVWTAAGYYTLKGGSSQTALSTVPDQYGIYHRVDSSKELILDSYGYYEHRNTPTHSVNIVTFIYEKNPEMWADAELEFVYENGTLVPGISNEFRTMMLPVGPLTLYDLGEPYYPPTSSSAPNAIAVGYFVGTTYANTYTACTFPEGFTPIISSNDPVKVYIIYKEGLVPITETYHSIVDDTASDTPIPDNSGIFSINNGFDPSTNVDITRPIGPDITGYVLFGYEVYRTASTNSDPLGLIKTVHFTWSSPNPYQTGNYVKVPATIENIQSGEEYTIKWLYYPDTDGDGIPDEYEASVTIYWRGMNTDGVISNLNELTVKDLVGTQKSFSESKNDYLDYPNQWIFNPTGYTPAGSISPSPSIALAKGTNSPVYFWYDADINENDIPDKDEHIIVKHRIYEDDITVLRPDDRIPFLLGGIYYGPLASMPIPQYHAVGWVAGDYNVSMDDLDIHLMDSLANTLFLGFETDPTPNDQVVTIIYKKIAAPITVHFTVETYMGTPMSIPSLILNGLVGQDVTPLVNTYDPLAGNSMWILDITRSVLPPSGEYKFTDTAQNYLLFYTENLEYKIITVIINSTDGRLDFEYREYAHQNDSAFDITAPSIPNYEVTGWTLYESTGFEVRVEPPLGTGTNDTVNVDPGNGHQILVFSYNCLDTEVRVELRGPNNELFDSYFLDNARVGEKYAVVAPHLNGWSLNDDLIKIIDPVMKGTNLVVFKYAEVATVTFEYYEVGNTDPIMRLNITTENTYTLSDLEIALAQYYYTFVPDISTGLPLAITQAMLDGNTSFVFNFYFTKDLVPVVITRIDETNVKIADDILIHAHPTDTTNWLRAGEMATVTTEDVPGWALIGDSSKAIYVDPTSTVSTPQVVNFIYRATEMGNVRVVYYTEVGSTKQVISEYTVQVQIGSTFKTTAPSTIPGFSLDLAAGESNPKTIFVLGATENLIEFRYEKDVVSVTVNLEDNNGNPIGTAIVYDVPKGVDHVVYA